MVVMQLNIQGLGSMRSQLIDLINSSVHSKDPDLLLLSETWLTPFSPTLTVPGYELYWQDRLIKKGGGVAILVSNRLSCYNRPVLSSKLEESECVSIKPDTPINVYTRFCLNTAKSKFSLVSPVADW